MTALPLCLSDGSPPWLSVMPALRHHQYNFRWTGPYLCVLPYQGLLQKGSTATSIALSALDKAKAIILLLTSEGTVISCSVSSPVHGCFCLKESAIPLQLCTGNFICCNSLSILDCLCPVFYRLKLCFSTPSKALSVKQSVAVRRKTHAPYLALSLNFKMGTLAYISWVLVIKSAQTWSHAFFPFLYPSREIALPAWFKILEACWRTVIASFL